MRPLQRQLKSRPVHPLAISIVKIVQVCNKFILMAEGEFGAALFVCGHLPKKLLKSVSVC